MRHSSIFLGVTLLAAPVFSQSSTGWEIVGSASVSDGPAICCHIAVSNANVIHVAYQDMSLAGIPASVQKFENGAWHYVGAKGSASIAQAWYCRLAFDDADRLYIANRDYGVSGRISVRRFEVAANAWVSVGPNGASPGEAHYTDIAGGPGGIPYDVFADRSTIPSDRATCMSFANGTWSALGGPGFSPSPVAYTSVAIDSSGAPWVAFADSAHLDSNFNGKVSVMRFDAASSTWSFVGQPGFTSLGGLNARLRLDHDGVPYVAYYQWNSALVVMKYNGTSWVQVGGPASGGDVPTVETEQWRQWLSIDFDSQNKPYVAYQMLNNQRRAAVRRWSGSSWVPVGGTGFSSGAADYMSMAIDRNDVPLVVFRDGQSGTRLTVMRYAPSPITYCKGVVSSLGCTPVIGASGIPSVTDPTPFLLTATQIINNRAGILLYSLHPDNVPFLGGYLCLRSPLKRAGVVYSDGSMDGADCSGTFSQDFNALIQTGQFPDLVPGAMIFAQYYYRDSHGPNGPGLTNGLRFTIGP